MYTIKRRRVAEVQVGCSYADHKEQGTQCHHFKGSYHRVDKEENITSYDDLLRNYLWDKDFTLSWLKQEGLIASSRICSICGTEMKWVECDDRSDGYVWECRKQRDGKRHRCERSIREGSWFEKSNLTIEEVLKFTYWWCQDLKQWQIKQQLGLGSHTARLGHVLPRSLRGGFVRKKRENWGSGKASAN